MKDEKLYTQFWLSRSGFLVTLFFDFLTLGGSLARTSCAISLKYVSLIFQREPKKLCLVTPKNVKNWHFLAIFSTKTQHIFAVVLATSIKGGFKIKYYCYI
jgi:hypothetical protein